MKRAVILLLTLVLLLGVTLTAEAADSFKLPDPLKTVAATTAGLGLPDTLPSPVKIREFTAEGDTVRLELESAVPQLKILEQNREDSTASTIFTKKNTSSAEAHIVGKDSSAFTARMIWPLSKMDFVREYAAVYGVFGFADCTATEKADPAAFPPYTSAVRTLSFTENGLLLSETWTLENDADRFVRTASYDEKGTLKSVRQTWESAKSGDYKCVAETDRDGNLTALTVQDRKSCFYAISAPILADPEAAMELSDLTADSGDFDEALEDKYPLVVRFLEEYEEEEDDDWDDDESEDEDEEASDDEDVEEDEDEPDDESDSEADDEADDEPDDKTDSKSDAAGKKAEDQPTIPANAKIWALNFDNYMNASVFVFVSEDAPIILKNGTIAVNPKAKDINGKTIGLKKNKVPSPALELAAAE